MDGVILVPPAVSEAFREADREAVDACARVFSNAHLAVFQCTPEADVVRVWTDARVTRAAHVYVSVAYHELTKSVSVEGV